MPEPKQQAQTRVVSLEFELNESDVERLEYSIPVEIAEEELSTDTDFQNSQALGRQVLAALRIAISEDNKKG